jgi:hypothetical protein
MSATGASAMVARSMLPAILEPAAAIEMATTRETHPRTAPSRTTPAVRTGESSSTLPTLAPEPPTVDRSSPLLDGFPNGGRSSSTAKVLKEVEIRPKQARTQVRAPMAGSPPNAANSSPGAALVIDAMRARRAGDFGRAADLLSEYQSTYPSGALREEALALSIEVAVRSGKNAFDLAARYLVQYPKGRFCDEARRALRSTFR